MSFDNGIDSEVLMFTGTGGRDRTVDTVANLQSNVTSTFTMAWTPPPAGSSSKGILTVSIDGQEVVFNNGGDLNWLDFTHFGIMPVSRDNNASTVWLDDLTFSSYRPILPPPTGGPTWNVNNNGDWLTAGNWSGGIPNAVGAVANFGNKITSPKVVFANSDVTVGTLNFANANSYLLAGHGTLRLEVATGSALVDVQQGAHKINMPVVVASNTTVQTAEGTVLRVSDPVTVNAGVSVSQTGAGTVLYESTVNVLGGGSIQFGNSSHMAALTLDTAATATVTSGANKVLNVDSVNIGDGRLDLTDNKLITRNAPGTATGGVYNGLQRDVQRARAGTAWNQPGLTTSEADAKTGKTTIGVSTGKQIRNLGPTQTSLWGGQTITATSTLAMYTYAGDANLDGTIDAGDYGIIDNFVQVAGADGYGNGDFNYDGFIDAGDYGIIDNNIQAQGTPFPVSGSVGGVESAGLSGVTAVPEPASLSVVGLAAAGLLRRRRRAK
jgi:hypothetical protein